MRLKAILLYIHIALTLAISTTGCRRTPTAPDGTQEAKTITVSIEPLRYAAERIAGQTYHVVTLVPKGSSPETYEPTPEQIVRLNTSIAYLTVGDLGFERTWTERLQQAAPATTFVRTSEGITMLEGHHHDHHTDTTDPHIWTSPANMALIAQNICHALCQLDTARTADFNNNLSRFLTDIQATHDTITHILADAPHKAFLIYHPALSYFARDYGLTQITIETDGKEPSPARLAGIIRQCKEKQVRTVFIQQEFDRKNAELIARETNAALVTINPLDYNWKEQLLNIALQLKAQ